MKTKSRYGYIRANDCYYAERIGYRWLPLARPKNDFKGHPFTHVLTTGALDGAYVLEPDTRVPNFTTNLRDTVDLARALQVNTEKYIALLLADIDAKLEETGMDLA